MGCIVHGVAKSWTRLSNLHFPFSPVGTGQTVDPIKCLKQAIVDKEEERWGAKRGLEPGRWERAGLGPSRPGSSTGSQRRPEAPSYSSVAKTPRPL